jgi:hypothetical protein
VRVAHRAGAAVERDARHAEARSSPVKRLLSIDRNNRQRNRRKNAGFRGISGARAAISRGIP